MVTGKRTDIPEFVLEDSLAGHREYVMSSIHERLHFEKGTRLSSGGEPSPKVYYLLEGLARASVVNIYGYERILGYHKRNSICCMDGLRKDAGVFVTVTAMTEGEAVPLDLDMLTALMTGSATFARDVLLYYSDVLRLMCLDAESQSSNSVSSKLANFILLYMQSEDYRRYGYLPFSQQELASAIGASRVQVARVCEQMKRADIVDIKKRKLYILRPDRLEDMASLEVRS